MSLEVVCMWFFAGLRVVSFKLLWQLFVGGFFVFLSSLHLFLFVFLPLMVLGFLQFAGSVLFLGSKFVRIV